jgi:hypothetical protein
MWFEVTLALPQRGKAARFAPRSPRPAAEEPCPLVAHTDFSPHNPSPKLLFPPLCSSLRSSNHARFAAEGFLSTQPSPYQLTPRSPSPFGRGTAENRDGPIFCNLLFSIASPVLSGKNRTVPVLGWTGGHPFFRIKREDGQKNSIDRHHVRFPR